MDNSLTSITSAVSTMRSLTSWCFNARSVVNKKLELFAKLTALSPDVVMITETYLDDTITNCEIVPANYTLYRLDRNRHGSGVLIAVLNKYTSISCPQYGRANIELLWFQIHIGLNQ